MDEYNPKIMIREWNEMSRIGRGRYSKLLKALLAEAWIVSGMHNLCNLCTYVSFESQMRPSRTNKNRLTKSTIKTQSTSVTPKKIEN